MTPVRVTSSSIHPNYAPCYLAQALGFFAGQGLEVDTSVPSGPGSSWMAKNLKDGLADFAMGGIWIPLAYRDRIAELPISTLVCDRNPQVILSRVPVDGFRWTDLHGKAMVLSLSATSQWMFLEGTMKKNGADPSKVTFLRDLDVVTMLELWRAGLGDYFLVEPLMGEELRAEGYHVAGTMAQAAGPCPWSVYYTTNEVLARPDDMAGRFDAAIQTALDWLHAHSDDEVATAIMPWFPEARQTHVAASLTRLRGDNVWRHDTQVQPDSFNAYQRIIADFGLIEAPFPFEKVVRRPALVS